MVAATIGPQPVGHAVSPGVDSTVPPRAMSARRGRAKTRRPTRSAAPDRPPPTRGRRGAWVEGRSVTVGTSAGGPVSAWRSPSAAVPRPGGRDRGWTTRGPTTGPNRSGCDPQLGPNAPPSRRWHGPRHHTWPRTAGPADAGLGLPSWAWGDAGQGPTAAVGRTAAVGQPTRNVRRHGDRCRKAGWARARCPRGVRRGDGPDGGRRDGPSAVELGARVRGSVEGRAAGRGASRSLGCRAAGPL